MRALIFTLVSLGMFTLGVFAGSVFRVGDAPPVRWRGRLL